LPPSHNREITGPKSGGKREKYIAPAQWIDLAWAKSLAPGTELGFGPLRSALACLVGYERWRRLDLCAQFFAGGAAMLAVIGMRRLQAEVNFLGPMVPRSEAVGLMRRGRSG